MKATDRSTLPRHLEVRTVEVITGRNRSITLSSVRCPVRSRSAPVEECARCGDGAGIAQDVLSRGEWLCCTCAAVEPVGEGPSVRSAMRPAAVAVRRGLSAATAASALRARGHAGAPVVDGEGRPVGWVAEADLLRARPGAKVADAMSHAALAVAETATLARAASLLASHRLDRIPVVSGDGAVVGVLSALDVLAWLAVPEGAGAPKAG